jgi:hypothetical protein
VNPLHPTVMPRLTIAIKSAWNFGAADSKLSTSTEWGKHFRIRFLRYQLTLNGEGMFRTINHRKVLKVLGHGSLLTDRIQAGKMRDFYRLAILRIENIMALINHDALAEVVALLPLFLCLSVIRLEIITRETREEMYGVGFFMVSELHRAKTEKQLPRTADKPAVE